MKTPTLEELIKNPKANELWSALANAPIGERADWLLSLVLTAEKRGRDDREFCIHPKEVRRVIDEEVKREREKIADYLMKYPEATLADYYADEILTKE